MIKKDITNSNVYKVAVYFFLILLTLYPVLSVQIPALTDYLNHLARIHINLEYENSKHLQENYDIHWGIIPNLAMDLIVLLLAKFMPLYTAGKIFVILSLLSMISGVILLRKAIHKEIGWWPLCFLPFVYNSFVNWGFISFTFTLGLGLNCFALWIMSETWNKKKVRATLFLILPIILFFCHLLAFAIYGVFIASYEAGKIIPKIKERKSHKKFFSQFIVLLQFVIPIILYFITNTSHKQNYDGNTYHFFTLHKLIESLSSPLPLLFQMSEVSLIIAILLMTFIIYSLIHGCLFSKEIRCKLINRKLLYPFISILIISILMPRVLLGVSFISLRFPPILVMLLIAGTNFEFPKNILKRIGLLSILLIQLFYVTSDMKIADSRAQEMISASKVIEEGSFVLFARYENLDNADNLMTKDRNFLSYLGMFIVIEKNIFTPHIFTNIFYLTASEKNKNIDTNSLFPIPYKILINNQSDKKFKRINVDNIIKNWKQNFDYILLLHPGTFSEALPKELKLMYQGSSFNIYKVSQSHD